MPTITFSKKFRGYDPQEVDKYIREKNEKESKLRASQKERIDQLADENYVLRQELKQYHADEQAIAQSLIESQNLAKELKGNAEAYSDLVLSRAKTFYATWRAYSQTLISSLSRDEVQAFNALQKKIEKLINAYEGKDVKAQAEAIEQAASAQDVESDTQSETVLNDEAAVTQAAEAAEESPLADATDTSDESDTADDVAVFQNDEPLINEGDFDEPLEILDFAQIAAELEKKQAMENPIKKVEDAAEQKIDLMELLRPNESLVDICSDFGLINKNKP